MDYNDFTAEICKKHGPKKTKVSNSWGSYDAYKFIRKNGWYDIGRPLKEGEFYDIIRGVNDLLANEIAEGRSVTFPHKMGRLELRKYERGVSIVDGKLKITYPIDWGETIRLWFEDEQAKKDKTLIRRENKYIYNVKYVKHNATYENKFFYEFTLNRFVKRALKDNINKGGIDTLW